MFALHYLCSALSQQGQLYAWREVASPSFVISVGWSMHLDITNTLSHPPA